MKQYEVEALKKVFGKYGINVISEDVNSFVSVVCGELKTRNGVMKVWCGTNGCMSIQKPNGKSKTYYNKSLPQISSVIAKVVENN